MTTGLPGGFSHWLQCGKMAPAHAVNQPGIEIKPGVPPSRVLVLHGWRYDFLELIFSEYPGLIHASMYGDDGLVEFETENQAFLAWQGTKGSLDRDLGFADDDLVSQAEANRRSYFRSSIEKVIDIKKWSPHLPFEDCEKRLKKVVGNWTLREDTVVRDVFKEVQGSSHWLEYGKMAPAHTVNQPDLEIISVAPPSRVLVMHGWGVSILELIFYDYPGFNHASMYGEELGLVEFDTEMQAFFAWQGANGGLDPGLRFADHDLVSQAEVNRRSYFRSFMETAIDTKKWSLHSAFEGCEQV